jgi:hypothetical protein
MGRRTYFMTALLLLAVVPSAPGLITSPLKLSKMLDDAVYICTVKVETIDAEKLGAVLVVDEDLKGKFPVRRLLVNLKGDAEADRYGDTKKLLKRIALKMTIVLLINEDKREKNKVTYGAFSYSNGTWFQLLATKAPEGEKTVFAFLHCEPYLRKTFKGTTEEMKTVINDVVAGIAKAPELDAKEPPGLGPEVTPEKTDK